MNKQPRIDSSRLRKRQIPVKLDGTVERTNKVIRTTEEDVIKTSENLRLLYRIATSEKVLYVHDLGNLSNGRIIVQDQSWPKDSKEITLNETHNVLCSDDE